MQPVTINPKHKEAAEKKIEDLTKKHSEYDEMVSTLEDRAVRAFDYGSETPNVHHNQASGPSVAK